MDAFLLPEELDDAGFVRHEDTGPDDLDVLADRELIARKPWTVADFLDLDDDGAPF